MKPVRLTRLWITSAAYNLTKVEVVNQKSDYQEHLRGQASPHRHIYCTHTRLPHHNPPGLARVQLIEPCCGTERTHVAPNSCKLRENVVISVTTAATTTTTPRALILHWMSQPSSTELSITMPQQFEWNITWHYIQSRLYLKQSTTDRITWNNRKNEHCLCRFIMM